jgi:diadenosine tetraphosphate (Ap4A) HIT family hydrolase
MSCPLCAPLNEDVIYKDDFLRVILVDEIPGYIRVITQKHIKELSELSDEEAVKLTLIVKKIEKTILKELNPDKINIASLGNMVPHLHIHIIPRYKNDSWWPGAVFCDKKRDFKCPPFNKENFKKAIKKALEK